ncbi:MAG: CRTAC1 family protein, partial [Phaeodactylibacter sp.]|nr:CRTAC1 family protein [Phaeodactylibacter sp.]
KFFINSTDGFVDQTARAGIQNLKGGLNTAHADYNNDGYIDIYILRGGWLGKGGNHPNSLLRNNGNGTFTDVTKAAGLLSFKPTQTAAWGDFNNDGWVDLFVGAEATKVGGELLNNPCELWLNKGDGSFEEVASQTGIQVNAFVKGCSWGDFNNDGWIDLYISSLNSANFLYVNQPGSGKTGRIFKNIAQAAGVSEPQQSFPAWFWDFNNDGWQDIFVSGYDLRQLNAVGAEAGAEYSKKATQGERPRLYKNNGDGTFSDVATSQGLDRMMYSMGANFGDLDNDGYLDFYVGTGAPDYRSVVPNRMFRNKAGQGFEEVTMSGFGHIQKGHGVAFGDLDNDGDQDIYAVMGGAFEGDVAQNVLFENPHQGQDWITLQLVGTDCNRSAIGAKVEVQLSGGRKIYRTVSTGGSFGASSLQLEIGLGTDATIEQVLVYWPGKFDQPQAFPGIEKNRLLQLTQGQSIPKYQNRPRLSWH